MDVLKRQILCFVMSLVLCAMFSGCLSTNTAIKPFTTTVNDELEKKMQDALVGVWHAAPSVGAGYAERFFFYEDGTFKFYYSQYDESKRVLDESGTYYVNGDQLVLYITNQTVLEGGEIVEGLPGSISEYSIINAEVKEREFNPHHEVVYTLGTIEQADDSPYEHKVLIDTMYYWKVDDNPYNEHFMN